MLLLSHGYIHVFVMIFIFMEIKYLILCPFEINTVSTSFTEISYVSSTTEQSTALPESTTELPVTRSDFMVPNWGIAVIVCGAVVLVFLLAMICVLVGRTIMLLGEKLYLSYNGYNLHLVLK